MRECCLQCWNGKCVLPCSDRCKEVVFVFEGSSLDVY